jgi:hypothetical protein
MSQPEIPFDFDLDEKLGNKKSNDSKKSQSVPNKISSHEKVVMKSSSTRLKFSAV